MKSVRLTEDRRFKFLSGNAHALGVFGVMVPFLILTVGIVLDKFEYALILCILFLPITLVNFGMLSFLVFAAMRGQSIELSARLLSGFVSGALGVLFYVWLFLPVIAHFN